MVRGASETNTNKIGNDIHDECLQCLSTKFNVDRNLILTDVDAMSILISTDCLTSIRKTAIKSFLCLFGSEWTLRVGLPFSPTGTSRQDGVFSCYGDNKCQHLPGFLQGNEMLVLSTPVKIAMHKSCQGKLVESLEQRKIHLTKQSERGGICFNPKRAANSPGYVDMVDALLESCFVESSRLHLLHVADFGCKKKVRPGLPSCPLKEFFDKLDDMRKNGVTVENCQTDIAFTIPLPLNRLVQFSLKRKRDHQSSTTSETVLKSCSLKTYPIHALPMKKGIIDNDKIVGTISLKKPPKKWMTLKPILVGSDLHEDEFSGKQNAACFYRNEEARGGVEQMSVNPSILHSVKVYSDIIHPYSQHRKNFPFKEKKIWGIGCGQIVSLKRLLVEIRESAATVFDGMKRIPVHSRIEVSLRPPPHEKPIRLQGHYNDILLHVYLAIDDLCSGESFHLQHNHSHNDSMLSHILALEKEVKSYLHFDSGRKFNEIYPNRRMTEWLRAQLSLMMISAGMSPDYGLKHINSWAKDKDRFDPFKRVHRMNSIMSRIHDPSSGEIDEISEGTREKLRSKLNGLKFSERGIRLLTTFASDQTSKDTPLDTYQKLNFQDKHLLSQWLKSEVIPILIRCMSKEDDTAIHITPNESVFDETRSPVGIISDAWLCQYTDASNDMIPLDPIARCIHRLHSLAIFSDFGRPLFHSIMCSFIVGCQEIGYYKNHQSGKEDAITKKVQNCIDKNENLTNNELQQLCKHISIDLAATNQSNSFYIRHICKFIGLPCSGVEYDAAQYYGNESTRKQKNDQLNEVIKSDMVRRIEQPNSNIVKLYRNASNTTITIKSRSRVMEPGIISSSSAASYEGYDVLKQISGINDTSQNNNNIRNFLCARIGSHIGNIDQAFLESDGHCMTGFEGISSLPSLESRHNIQIIFDGSFSSMGRATNFKPRIMLPITSLALEKDITFCDSIAKKIYMYTYQEKKCIVYTPNEDNYRPKEDCFIVTLGSENSFSWTKYSPIPQIGRYQHTDNHDQRRLHCLSNVRTEGHTNRDKAQRGFVRPKKNATFTSALCELVKSRFACDPATATPKDILVGIHRFLEQLSTLTKYPTIFHQSVIENSELLRSPPRLILNHLREDHPAGSKGVTHEVLCPLICLKYKVTIGVFSLIKKKKSTTFYAYDPRLSVVVCKKIVGAYSTLSVHRKGLIYMWTTEKKVSYYSLNGTKDGTEDASYLSSIRGKFFHADPICLQHMTEVIKIAHGMNLIIGKQPDSLRPEEKALMILTTVINTRIEDSTIQEMKYFGVPQNAIIIIFPHGGKGYWEGCMVHHPKQNLSDTMDHFNSIMANTTHPNEIRMSYIEGVTPSDTEEGLLMLFYAYIGHSVDSVTTFMVTMEKVKSDDNPDLKNKICDWMFNVHNKPTDRKYIPAWFDILCSLVHL